MCVVGNLSLFAEAKKLQINLELTELQPWLSGPLYGLTFRSVAKFELRISQGCLIFIYLQYVQVGGLCLSPSPAASWSSGILPLLFCLSLVAQNGNGKSTSPARFRLSDMALLTYFGFSIFTIENFFVVTVVSG